MRKHFVAAVVLLLVLIGILSLVLWHAHLEQLRIVDQITRMGVAMIGPRAAVLVPIVFVLFSFFLYPLFGRHTATGTDLLLPEASTLRSELLPIENLQTLELERIPLSDIRRIVFGSPRSVVSNGFQDAIGGAPWIKPLLRSPLDNWLSEVTGVEFTNGEIRLYRSVNLRYFRSGDLTRANLPKIFETNGITAEGDVAGLRTGADMGTRALVLLFLIFCILVFGFLLSRYILFVHLFESVDWRT